MADGQFEVFDPVPLTLDREAFRATVEVAAERFGLRVQETTSPFCVVVTAL